MLLDQKEEVRSDVLLDSDVIDTQRRSGLLSSYR